MRRGRPHRSHRRRGAGVGTPPRGADPVLVAAVALAGVLPSSRLRRLSHSPLALAFSSRFRVRPSSLRPPLVSASILPDTVASLSRPPSSSVARVAFIRANRIFQNTLIPTTPNTNRRRRVVAREARVDARRRGVRRRGGRGPEAVVVSGGGGVAARGLSVSRQARVRHGAVGGGGEVAGVLREDPALVLRLGRVPRLAALRELLV